LIINEGLHLLDQHVVRTRYFLLQFALDLFDLLLELALVGLHVLFDVDHGALEERLDRLYELVPLGIERLVSSVG